MSWSDADLSTLIDAEGGSVDPRIYTDEALYQLELERVFGRNWLCLGHASQLPQAHDFVLAYMAEDPVLVVRQADGGIRAFLNQCRHRGMPVTPYERGNARSFTCPYHGWTYDSAGHLAAVPMEATAFKGCLDKARNGLIEVPRVERYKGLVFGNWDVEAASLTDYLGEAAWYADAVIDRSPAGMEAIGGIHKWVIPCNWKLAAEQFCTDMYHVGLTHFGTMVALFDGPPPGGNPAQAPGLQYVSGHGHGTGFFIADSNNALIGAIVGQEVGAYYNGPGMDHAEAHLGAPRARGMSASHTTVFPNLSFLGGINTLRIWHPRGPQAVEVWALVLVPADAPDDVKEGYRRGVGRTFSPSGVFEQDDAENWSAIQRTLRGARARRTRFNAQMGRGRPAQDHPDYPGAFPGHLHDCFSEEAGRGFYARWLAEMQRT